MDTELEQIDKMMDLEIQRVKAKYEKIKEDTVNRSKAGKYKRKSIPKAVKDKVWDTYIGIRYGVGPCHCCQGIIDSKNFDCGHILAAANGGENIVENLRPLCSTCNKSMGKQNLEEFKQIYFGKKKKRSCCKWF